MTRYLPSVVLSVITLLIVAGASDGLIRVVGVVSILLAVVAFIPTQVDSLRSERRRPGRDRRHA